ncbi:MAG: hypothetical protein ABS87_10130 [Sphingomonas sp. SCN 67-18]|nr:MAG: hypothetical protein ABS87_10130 [Sphingomonas sp. SCN 67-18]
MIRRLIHWSVQNRFFVLLGALALVAAGLLAVRSTPIDALPDLSDTQVIIRTSYPGQAPQIVENQVTYPLASTMLSVPGAKTVRAYSFFGDSFVYVIFEDGTDLYWARSRVLEYLNQVQGRLPETARSAIGPDATGVGWVYEYALVDRTGHRDLAQLRGLQDWFLRYELKSLPGVAEVASIGGMVKQYQVVLDPVRLAAYGVTHSEAVEAIRRANQEAGGSVLELGEAEYMVRASGYLKTLDDFRAVPLRTTGGGVPVTLGDVATLQIGPEMRRGITELDGEGEVAGGVVILRSGADARSTIEAVQSKLDELKAGLPSGVARHHRFAVECLKLAVDEHGLCLDDVEEPCPPGRIAGGFEVGLLARERQQRVARAHPLLMVRDMVGKCCLEVGGECATHILLPGERRSGDSRAGGDHRILAAAGKERQADRDARRDHVAIALRAPLIGDIECPVRPLLGAGKSDVRIGLTGAGRRYGNVGMSVDRGAQI